MLISNLYKEHEYLLDSNKLSKFDKIDYKEIILGKASIGVLPESVSDFNGVHA